MTGHPLICGLTRGLTLGFVALLTGCAPALDEAKAPVRVVGSSTVYPFAVRAAERAKNADVTIVIEQTGSGGGHKIFCAENSRADMVMSSRRRLGVEAADCARQGRSDVIELALGFDGIVVAQQQASDRQNSDRPKRDAHRGVPTALSRHLLWQALAENIPSGVDCSFQPNPYQRWADVDPRLPDRPILVYGPPPTSGTRDGFVALVMEAGALSDPCMAQLAEDDITAFRQWAGQVREDGAWVDAGENDASLIQALRGMPGAMGVLSHATAARAGRDLELLPIDGIAPSGTTLKSRTYPLLRPLYLYVDQDMSLPTRRLVDAILSDEALGDEGYLSRAGLIGLRDADRQREREKLNQKFSISEAAP